MSDADWGCEFDIVLMWFGVWCLGCFSTYGYVSVGDGNFAFCGDVGDFSFGV